MARDPAATSRTCPLPRSRGIYLNAESARNTFNYTGGGRSTRPSPGFSGGAQSGEITVQANMRWTDTGVAVRRGDVVRFQTRGQIKFGEAAR